MIRVDKSGAKIRKLGGHVRLIKFFPKNNYFAPLISYFSELGGGKGRGAVICPQTSLKQLGISKSKTHRMKTVG